MPQITIEVVAAVVAAGTFLFWGGELRGMVKQLRSIAEDHEDRIRRLEGLDIQ